MKPNNPKAMRDIQMMKAQDNLDSALMAGPVHIKRQFLDLARRALLKAIKFNELVTTFR